MQEYNPQKIEPKWQKFWEENGFYKAEDFSKKPKKYILIEFPYPSGEGLHVGHARSYSALDAVSRKKRMEGFNVLFPIGWDAFGLPTENYAIKTGIHPRIATEKNVANYKRQLKSLGLSFDWSREINTTDPGYYKWTQWIFLKLFEKGLAYQAEIPINFCPACKIGLANEEVVGGKCERCGTEVVKKTLKQWMIKITKYADRLIDDLKEVDYPERVKAQQINWIGKSYGTEIDFELENAEERIKVFTTRTDTLFGVTAVVLAPEHPLVQKLITKENEEKIKEYIESAKKKSDFEREKLEKEKTGVFTGSYCVNPGNSEKVPIWVGDYVVATYGGGAVMMVPAHDYRDFDFAKKYGLKIKEVVSGGAISKEAFVDYGILINSGEFDGLKSEEAIEKITKFLEKKGLGRKTIQYKLRDWIFSRQHYWGEPIPIIHCEKCGAVPVPEKDLPVELPYVEKYQPTGTGESPLFAISEWVNTKCPKCQGSAKRETDTMPNWAGSNWYYLRYLDPVNDKTLADAKKMKYWMPIDWYNGGMEHTTLHLLYSRFIYKFLFDIGVVPQKEPYQKRTCHGIILAADGRKMSKSFGNVINPDEIVQKYGADTLRLYEMFLGPFDQAIAWNEDGVKGVYRFLEKVWNLVSECSKNKESNQKISSAINKLNKKIDEDLEAIKFNTIISSFMEFVNLSQDNKKEVGRETIEKFLILLSPFAPHIAEELWSQLGHKKSIFFGKWPKPDSKLIKEKTITLIIQINGKVRDKIEVAADISEDEAQRLTISRENVKKWTQGKEIKKIIFVPNKLINIVVNS
ncbi:MAG: leucine--tRNA ligase [Candidatus Nealsonbacteria bacterium RBG_13_42_11]|uniref:Leucine--tRNA ligase n=1 Tax=Candidatus Nealsonbacteria bacterium RBG_13_42_11 TaxID=1801663 RepID=A0A1G2DZT2_9BACT|nr:MAG: leucine--tRNA ligase [Candidatus Nealsonbacteria bacterium RBG_13_42_11]